MVISRMGLHQDRVSQADRYEVICRESSLRLWSVSRFTQITLAVGTALRVDIDPFPALRADFVKWAFPRDLVDDAEKIAHPKNRDNTPEGNVTGCIPPATGFLQNTGANQSKSKERETAKASVVFFGKRMFLRHCGSAVPDLD